jgi:superoxide reductase
MKLLEPQSAVSEGEEKHVPAIEKTKDGYLVKIGSIPHPMKEDHYIEWIEINIDGEVYKKFLSPEEKPEFKIKTSAKNIKAREYCNIHGLWTSS